MNSIRRTSIFSSQLIWRVFLLSAMALATHVSWAQSPAQKPALSGGRPEPASYRWLLTHDGERRGLLIESDLKADAPFWELRGNGHQGTPLDSLRALCFSDRAAPATPGIAINGGYWNEHLYPVGICAGQAGIHAARSHRWGFAIGPDRAWITHLKSTLRLREGSPAANPAATRVLFEDIALNPRPLPRQTPYLIDTHTYPWPLVIPGPAQVFRLTAETFQPLAYNTTAELAIGNSQRFPTRGILAPDNRTRLFLILPEAGQGLSREAVPPSGTPLRLDLILEPVKGQVRLATCGGPRLASEGHLTDELIAIQANDTTRRKRTAIGCDREGRRLWIVLLSRGLDGKEGVSLGETARTLIDLGATDALNLDGGSSTQAWCPQLEPELSAFFPLRLPVHHALFLRRQLIKKPSHP